MKELEERILRDGKSLPGGILKVDNFINHRMDSVLMCHCAEEFLKPEDHLLFIDDFLACGNAALGMADLCRQAIVTELGDGRMELA